jgi:hypothetical protein
MEVGWSHSRENHIYICLSELQINFYFKEYSPSGFEIKGYFAFQKKSRRYLVNSLIIFFSETPKKCTESATILFFV